MVVVFKGIIWWGSKRILICVFNDRVVILNVWGKELNVVYKNE